MKRKVKLQVEKQRLLYSVTASFNQLFHIPTFRCFVRNISAIGQKTPQLIHASSIVLMKAAKMKVKKAANRNA